jgi:hypothetical protein
LHRRFKRRLVVGVAALAVVALAGGAYAATKGSGPSTRQAFLNDVAKRLHVTPAQLSAALGGAYTDQLQAQVKAGRLTQAQANSLEQRLKSNGSAPLPYGLPGSAPFHGRRAIGPPGAFGPRGAFGGGGAAGAFGTAAALPAAASYLGLTNASLLQQLSSGKSLAQIATSKGKTAAGLEQAMTAGVKTKLDQAVTKKSITAAQEQQILSGWSAQISKLVNSTDLGFRPLGFLFRTPGPRPGPGRPPGAPGSPNGSANGPPNGSPNGSANGQAPPAALPVPYGPPPAT